jgi:hypothetical protein
MCIVPYLHGADVVALAGDGDDVALLKVDHLACVFDDGRGITSEKVPVRGVCVCAGELEEEGSGGMGEERGRQGEAGGGRGVRVQ